MTTAPRTEGSTQATTPDPFSRLPAIFRECIDPEPGLRFDLTTPWRDGFYVYATDGRIVARMAVSALDPEYLAEIPVRDPAIKPSRPGRRPDAASIFDDKEGTTEALPTPLPGPWIGEVPAGRECPNCRATGRCVCECCDVRHECGRCGGSRVAWYAFADRIRLSGRQAALLRRHGARLHLPLRPRKEDHTDAARWTLGYVEGYVMGMLG